MENQGECLSPQEPEINLEALRKTVFDLRNLWQREGISQEEAKTRIKELKMKGEFDAVYQRSIERIKKETNFFREIEELGLLSGFTVGFKKFHWDKAKIRWNPLHIERIFFSDTVPWRRPMGHYDYRKNLVWLYFWPTKKEEILEYLVDKDLPYSLKGLLHEATHAFQCKESGKSKQEPENLRLLKRPLGESQAFMNQSGSTFEDLFEEMKGTVSCRGVKDNQLLYSSKAIPKLAILGLSVQEIGDLVSQVNVWDEEREIYPQIEEVIRGKLKELSLENPNWDELDEERCLKRTIDRLRTSIIVREELARDN